MALALLRDLREHRASKNWPDFETDVLAGHVLARVSAGLPSCQRPWPM